MLSLVSNLRRTSGRAGVGMETGEKDINNLFSTSILQDSMASLQDRSCRLKNIAIGGGEGGRGGE